MKFLVQRANFMGHVITTEGLLPNPITVQAVVDMPTPSDKQGVRRFLGAINYLSKFCPHLSKVTQPLRSLGKANITVHTDHQPLQSIFQKDLASAPKRLQKMMLFLQRYNFTVVYRKGSSLHLADTLSRAPCQDTPTTSPNLDTFQVFRTHIAQLDPTSTAITDVTRAQLRTATESCPDMQLLQHHIIHGWPPTKGHLPDSLQAFWHFREDLSVADGILLKSNRAIVPASLKSSMLEKIHQSHRGTESCLRFAREAVFWPSMTKDIEKTCHSCPSCAKYGKQAPAEPMLSQPIPTRPWQFVSQDIFEHERKLYLVTVDHYSDFYELDKLQDTQSSTIVDLTKAHFARHGIPLRCLTDNGPQFISAHYRNFAHKYGFQHVTSSPYWSRRVKPSIDLFLDGMTSDKTMPH